MNYKLIRLGDYIKPYDEINQSKEFNSIDDLQGINSNKYFQECKSNKNEIDIYRYRICRNNTFAYNKATSRNGEKISIAYRTEGDCLISPSYQCFTITDNSVINAEYLMLLFKQPIFDKYARFNSWGSATEFLNWEDFCNIKLNIPELREQEKIIKNYKLILNRILLLEKLNNSLSKLCKLKLNQFFEDVKNANDTYFIKIGDLVNSNERNYSSKDKFNEILYLDTGSIADNYISEIKVINTKTDEIPSRCKRKVKDGDILFSTVRPNNRHFGIIYKPAENFIVSTGFSVLTTKQQEISAEFIYMLLTSDEILQDINEIAELSVTTYPTISNDDLLNITIEIPQNYDYNSINKILKIAFFNIEENNKELRVLYQLKDNYIGIVQRREE